MNQVKRVLVTNSNPVRAKYFDPQDPVEIRCYEIGDTENPVLCPSITTILDATNTADWLWKWKLKEASKPTQLEITIPHGHNNIHTYRGDLVHALIEAYLTDFESASLDSLDDSAIELALPFFELFKEFLCDVKSVHALEQSVYSPDLRLAGRYDAIVKLKQDNKTYLADWKTSGKLKSLSQVKDYEYQLSVYHHLINKENPGLLDGGLICIACHGDNNKPHELRVFPYDNSQLESLFDEFMNTRYQAFWQWVNFIH